MSFSHLNFNFKKISCQSLKIVLVLVFCKYYFTYETSAAALKTIPSSVVYGIYSAKPLKIVVRIDTFSPIVEVRGAEIELKFDPDFLEVVDKNMIPVSELAYHPNFDDIKFWSRVDNFLGRIEHTAFSYSLPYRPYNTTYVDFVEIYFRAKKIGTTYLRFNAPQCFVMIVGEEDITVPPVVFDSTIHIREYSAVEGGKPYSPLLDGNFLIRYNFIEEMSSFVLKVYDRNGKVKREIFPSKLNATKGEVEFEWDGKDKEGKYVLNGVYIYQVEERSRSGVIYSKPKLIGVFK